VIADLLQRQIDVQLNLIYSNLYDFVKFFFGEEEAEFLPDLEYTIRLGSGSFFVQQRWMDEDGIDCTAYFEIDYSEYNKWYKENIKNV